MITVTTSVRNDNPNTIWNRLAARLGREPTIKEGYDEVVRILREVSLEQSPSPRIEEGQSDV